MLFKYWNKYKDEQQTELDEDYVEKKHANFKEEMMHYDSLNITELYEVITPKINQYLQSDMVKTIKEPPDDRYHKPYSIKKRARTGFNNLVSIVLYTGYTKLRADFTSTFRKKWKFEPIEEAKRRHRKYYW